MFLRVTRTVATPILLAGLLAAAVVQAREVPSPVADAGAAGYRLPAPALRAIVDAPQAPRLSLSPRRDLLAYMQVPSLPRGSFHGSTLATVTAFKSCPSKSRCVPGCAS